MNNEAIKAMEEGTRALTEEDLEQVNGGMLPILFAGLSAGLGTQLDPADGKSIYLSPQIGGSLDDEPGHLLVPGKE